MKSVRIFLVLILGICSLSFLPVNKTFAFDLFPSCSNGSSGAPSSEACRESDKAGSDTKGNNIITRTIETAANLIAVLTGVVALVLIIVSGLTLATSGGNSDSVTSSRRRIVYSLVGLVIVSFAWAITRFVIDKAIQ
jgi:ABC-type dipeptide/oligopeptide/nickel transport system permease subunit